MTTKNVLIVDDEPDIRELLDITISRMGIKTQCAKDVASAKQQIKSTDFQLCLTDMKLPDGSGLDLIEFIQSEAPQLPVAMITAYSNVETAIQALKAGAFDFISKPVDLDNLRTLISTALKLDNTATPVRYDSETNLLGNTEVIRSLRTQINKLARSQAPVYITGESGSGKEMVARLIHAGGPGAHNPFVPINCGAIPAELMESELFGHRKGSFTGAIADKIGLFQAADGGTLFLDEVADLPLAMQVKLLRAIQEKAVRPVGSKEEIPINVRILSATHKNLAHEVAHERFRQDLYYRINVIELKVPSLRERKADIPLLAEFCLSRLVENLDMDKPVLDEKALEALTAYDYPGNVRELENILERAFTLCEGKTIKLADLQFPAGTDATVEKLVFPSDTELDSVDSLESYLENIEREIIIRALEKTRWNRTSAAKKLGLSFRALRYRLQKLGID